MIEPHVLIVILNWNNPEETLGCIASLRAMTYQNYSVLVIDNGSTDNSVEVLSRQDDIELISLPENLGFTGGCNHGMRQVTRYGASYVWLLNNDALAAPDCLSQLIRVALENSDAGLLSPVLYHRDRPEQIQHHGSRYIIDPPEVEEAPDLVTTLNWQREDARQCILWGTALLVPVATLARVGYLDERLFAYAEDTDYSIRCGEAGLAKLLVPDAKVWHAWNIGIRRPHYYYYMARNELLLWFKHAQAKAHPRLAYWHYLRTRDQIVRLGTARDQVEACIAGFWDGIFRRKGAYGPHRKSSALLKRILLRGLSPAATD